MNKIETMKRKEILQNLKFVEEIVIRTSAIAEYEVTHPEDYANSIDEMRGVRFGAEVTLQALYETFPELMQEDFCFNIPVIDTCVVLTAKDKKTAAKANSDVLEELFSEVK